MSMYRYSGRTTLPFLLLAIVALLATGQAQGQSISFGSSGLAGESSTNPTSLHFGPDGRLYVTQVDGLVKSYVVNRNAANDYVVVGTETISLIQGIPNHNDDDGSPAPSETERQITGIYAAGTAANPVLYVSSSDPRIGAGGGGNDLGLDTNSGIVTRLTCVGGLAPDGASCVQWDMVHLVRGLPRSEENHAVNGLQLSPDGNTLYLAVGGHTNAGGPSNNFAFTTEYALSSAVLAIDLPAIEALGVKTDAEGQQYYYDLPTLDDPTRSNANGINDPAAPGYDGVDSGDPWGGNDGLNQAKVVPGGPVSLYATGFRNLYDIVLTQSGRMYGVDNGANGNWGGYPEYEESYDCTNNALPGEPGSTSDGPNPATYPPSVQLHDGLNGTVASDGAADSKVNNKNGLHLIPQGYYGGHPTPIRGNPAGAGLYYNGTFFAAGSPNLPVDWPPVPVSMANPVECDFQNSGVDDGALANYGPSTNGITEYTASNFSGALQGDLFMAGFKNSAPVYRAILNATGDVVTNCTGSQGVPANCGETIFEGFGSQPLDVVAQGDADPFPGTVWAATYGADFITVFEPADYDGGNVPLCDGTDDDTIDEDADGYTNADEIDNQTDPCSAGSQPTDNDGTLATDGFKDSDLNDPDDDDDTVADVNDAFAIDNTNGKSTSIPLVYNLFNETPGVNVSFFGLGFTGFMTNGITDYLDQFVDSDVDDPCAIVAGGTAGLLTYCATAGDAFEGNNTQDNGLQFGIDVDVQTGPFTVLAQINSPFFGGVDAVDFQSQGIYLGTGDQDNYLRLAMRGNGGTNGLQVLFENAGVATQTDYPVTDLLLADGVELLFKVDPAAGTVQPAYALDDGIVIDLGSPLALSGDLLAAVQGTYEVAPGVPSALAVGTIATSRGGAEFSGTWDFFTVDYGPNTAPGQWAFVDDFDESRHENAFVQAGDKFFLLGGRESQVPRVYDISTQTWTSGTALPTGTGWPDKLHHFQAVELDGLIYAVGAMTGGCCAEPPAERVYAYDPVGDAWMQGHEIPVDRRRGGGGAVVYNGKIYLVSGNTNGHSGPVSPLFDEYDPYTGQWTTLPDIPNPRDHFFAVVHEDKLYAIAGRDSNQGEDGNIFDDTIPEVDVYDFALGTWTTLPPGANIPTPRAAAATGILGGEIVVAGGESNTTAHDVTEAFDPNTYSWRTLSTMLGPRHATQGVINNGGLYVAGGSPQKGGPGSAILNLEAFYADGVTTPTGSTLIASTLEAPDTLSFGQVAATQTSTLPLVVTNSGGDQAIIVESIALSGGAAFALNTAFSGPLVLAPGASLSLDIDFTPPSDQAAAGVLSITHGGGMFLDVALSGNSTDDLPLTAVLYRVNAGGAFVASTDDGPDWGTDADASPSAYLAAGGEGTYSAPVGGLDASVPAGTPTALFETERWDDGGGDEMLWSFPTGDGDFIVRLYMMNGWNGTNDPGERVFDVNVEGGAAEVVGLDLSAEFGHQVGGMIEIPATVADGTLDVEFLHIVENPLINAIEILGGGTSTPSNTPPVVMNPGDQLNDEGDAPAFDIAATDSDGPENLAYSATGLPPGIELEPTNGDMFGTIDTGAAAGSPYPVVVSVSDGADVTQVSFAWTVTVPGSNTLPVFEPVADVSVTEGDSVVVAVSAADADLDALTLWAQIDDGGSALAGNDDTARIGRSATLASTASAERRGFSTASTSQQLGSTATPAARSSALTDGTHGGSPSAALVDPATYTFTDNGDGTGLLEWLTPPDAAGAYTATVFASDGTDTTTVPFAITVGAHLPMITITAPADGATLSGNGVTVTWATTAALSTDHVHVTLDAEAPIGSLPLNGSWTFTDLSVGDHTLQVEVADQNHVVYTNPEATQTITVTVPEPLPPSAVLYRVNAGGAFVASTDDGPDWGTDADASPSAYLAAGGERTKNYPVGGLDASVPAGTPTALFETERLDLSGSAPDMLWSFPTGDGEFVVRLYVMSGLSKVSEPGERVFDVNAEGGAVEVGDLDPTAQFGFRTGGMVEFPATVVDGMLDVEFLPVVQNTAVNAIEILDGVSTSTAIAEAPPHETFRASYTEGWNLIALPLDASESSFEKLAVAGSEAMRIGTSDFHELPSPADITPGEGYWLKIDETQSVEFVSQRTDHHIRSLDEGWNLITGGSCVIPADLVYANTNVVPHSLFGFDGVYQTAAHLLPGSAYWVRATAATTLELSCSDMYQDDNASSQLSAEISDFHALRGSHSTKQLVPEPHGFIALTVSDARGHSRPIYFGSSLQKEAHSEVVRYGLPPLPPPDAFDVRLAGDMRLSDSDDVFVHVQTSDYPLQLTLDSPVTQEDDVEVEAYVDGAPVAIYSLPQGEVVTLKEHGIDVLHVRTTTATMPDAFALVGVYPNPVVDEVNVAFNLPERADVKMELYDVLGRRVHSAEDLTMEAGANHVFRLRTTTLAAGAYFFRLVVGTSLRTRTETGRITVIR